MLVDVGAFRNGIIGVHKPAVAKSLPFWYNLKGKRQALRWNFGDHVRRHPTQIYECLFHLGMAIVLWQLLRHHVLRRQHLKLYLIVWRISLSHRIHPTGTRVLAWPDVLSVDQPCAYHRFDHAVDIRQHFFSFLAAFLYFINAFAGSACYGHASVSLSYSHGHVDSVRSAIRWIGAAANIANDCNVSQHITNRHLVAVSRASKAQTPFLPPRTPPQLPRHKRL